MEQDNILINIDGSPILSDFGISRMLVESHTITGTKELKGSVRYMAIELFTGPRGLQHCLHTKATDVWAFGMISYVSDPMTTMGSSPIIVVVRRKFCQETSPITTRRLMRPLLLRLSRMGLFQSRRQPSLASTL